MLEPVGPLSPKTYWIRRIALVVAVVVILLLVVWMVVGRGADSSTPSSAPAPTTSSVPMTGELAASTGGTPTVDPTGSVPAAGSSAAGTTDPATPSDAGSSVAASAGPETAATTSADVTAVPAPTADPGAAAAESAAAQSAADAAAAQVAAEAAAAQASAQAAAEAARPRDAEGRLICPDTAINLAATVGSATYNVGEQPIVGVTVVNIGTEACVRDVSGSLQEYLAYDTAGTRLWSTNDCLPGEGTDVRFLQPGESLQYNIRWSGTTSAPGCAAERTRVPAGEYRIEARLGGLVSSQTTLTFR